MILLFRILCTLGLNLIHVYQSECISLTFKMPKKDTFLPDNEFLNNTAPSMFHCIDICYRFNFCKSINYLRAARQCMLNYEDTATVKTVIKAGSYYMERDQFPNELIPPLCVNHHCSTDDLCVESNKCSTWRYIDCGPPDEDLHSTLQYKSTMVYSKAQYKCTRTPPSQSGIDSIQCGLSGRWSGRIQCPEHCLKPPTIHSQQNISYKYSPGGAVCAMYSCSSFPDTNPVKTCPVSWCTKGEKWKPASLSCSAKDCIQEGTKNYKGRVSCTVNGRTCKRWSAWVPHLSSMMPHISEWGTNYCRALGNVKFPWCYTTDRAVRWEYCHVPLC